MKDQFPPSISAGKLYERTSAKGTTYLTGYLGPVRIVALKTNETDDHGNPIWNLRIAEAPPCEKPADKPSTATAQDVGTGAKPSPKSDFQAPLRERSAARVSKDVEIPF